MLFQHLTSADSLSYIALEGLDEDLIPNDRLRPVYRFAMHYFHQSRCLRAPTEDVFRSQFGGLIDDEEISFEEPEETIEWAVDDLKATFAHLTGQQFNKDMARALAAASEDGDPRSIVKAIGNYASDLVSLSIKLETSAENVELRTAVESRILAFESRAEDRGRVYGMQLGIPAVDEHTFGIHPGEIAVFSAGPKVGKALVEGTRVLTPTGWRVVEGLAPGDIVMGAQGPTRVLGVARWSNRPLMRVVTDDGGTVVVDAAHDWTVHPHSHGGRVQVVDTKTLAAKIVTNRRFAYLPLPDPVRFDCGAELPLDPYLLGLLLGDGGLTGDTPTFTSADGELHDALVCLLPEGVEARRRNRYSVGLVRSAPSGKNPLTEALRLLGVMGCRSQYKRIPDVYMTASIEDRLALLQGLLDTDGGVDGKGVSFCTTSAVLARQVQDLVWSLGGTARQREKETSALKAHVVRLRVNAPVFRLSRKLRAYAERGPAVARPATRRIVEVIPAGVGDTICIEVDAPDSLFITEDFLVTHNSYGLCWAALNEWRAGRPVALITLENAVDMMVDRIACLACNVDASMWQRGTSPSDDVERVRTWVDEVIKAESGLWVLRPEPGRRTPENLVRQAQLRGAASVCIDQLTFVEHPDPGRKPRHEVVRDIMHLLKAAVTSGSTSMPCLIAHQINREGVKRAAKVGYHTMEDLAESSEVERTADWVFALYQTEDQRIARRALLQILAARRERIKNWLLHWDIAVGNIGTIEEVRLG